MPEKQPKLRSFEELPTGTKIARNAGFGALRVLLVAPIPLLLTPFIIQRIGTRGLGIWAVFISVNNLTSLADFGFLATLTKHASEYFTKKDYVQLNRTINSGILLFSGIGVLCGLLINYGSGWFISTFLQNAPFSLLQLRSSVRWLAVAIALNLLALSFSSVITGLQRLDVTNLLSAINAVATAALAAAFLAKGLGVLGLAYAIVLAAALNLSLNIAASRYLLHELKFSVRFIQLGHLAGLFSFSLRLYLVQMAGAVHNHTEKFLLAHFTGLSAAGSYDIANDLAAKSKSLPSLLLSPLLPAAAELEARGEDSRTRELYYRAHKYLAFLGIPVVALAGALSHRFVALWLGPGFSSIAFALGILAAVQMFNLSCAPGALILTGKGILWPAVRASVLGITANLALSTILVLRFGLSGAVYGTGVSLTAATVYFLVLFHRETRYPVARLFQQSLKPLLWAAVLGIPASVFLSLHMVGWFGLFTIALGFIAAYCGGLLVGRYFDAFDLEALERCLPIPKVVRRILLFA